MSERHTNAKQPKDAESDDVMSTSSNVVIVDPASPNKTNERRDNKGTNKRAGADLPSRETKKKRMENAPSQSADDVNEEEGSLDDELFLGNLEPGFPIEDFVDYGGQREEPPVFPACRHLDGRSPLCNEWRMPPEPYQPPVLYQQPPAYQPPSLYQPPPLCQPPPLYQPEYYQPGVYQLPPFDQRPPVYQSLLGSEQQHIQPPLVQPSAPPEPPELYEDDELSF